MNKTLFLSNKDCWETPAELFNKLNVEFGFTLDPCCTPKTAKCDSYFTKEDDGLSRDWSGVVFMNPPYGRGIKDWMAKAYSEAIKGTIVVCLVPARVDTRWWHSYAMRATEIRLPTKRLTFVGADNKAPFPVAIVIFKGVSNEPKLTSMVV